MDDVTLHRKRRLRALIDGSPYNGSQLAFAQAIRLTEGRVSQLLDPKHSFGERSARKIATELRLADRFFEEGFVPETKEPNAEVLNQFDKWMTDASPRSREVIDQLKLLAQKNMLGDEEWELIRQIAQRFHKNRAKH